MTGSADARGASDGALTDPGLAGLTAENRWLRGRLAQRHLLDLAAGVLAAQMRLSPSEAADHLDSLSRATGLSAEDIAADIVNAVDGDRGPSVTALPASDDHALRQLAERRRTRRTAAAAETADTAGEAARTLLDGGLTSFGADSLWLWRRTGPGCLRLTGHAGVGAAEAVAWQWIPPAAPEPFRSVLAANTAVWLEEGPTGGELLPGPSAGAARALLPLTRRDRTIGVALVGWPGPTPLDAAVRRAVAGLLEIAGTVLDTEEPDPATAPVLVDVLDSLAHPAGLLRMRGAPGVRGAAVEHLNDEAVAALGSAAPADGAPLAHAFPAVHGKLARLARRALSTTHPQRVARLPVSPRPGEAPPMLDVRVLPAGEEHAVLLWHTVAAPGLATARAVAMLQDVAPFQDSLTGGETVWAPQAYGILGVDRAEAPVPLTDLRDRVHPDDRPALTELLTALIARQAGAQAVLRIVLADGAVRHVRVAAEPLIDKGVVTGLAGAYQDVSDSRRTEAALTATFDHLTALHDRSELRHHLALQLQQAIVPEVPGLQELPGDLVVAARYRPAAEEYRVGGDWYDVLALPSGRILVAVGDIAGHGIDSVTGMVALRNAQRALAFTGHSARRLMGWLNEVTLRTGGGTTATAVCALYDPEDRGLVWSSAGHLPMLLLRDGRARLLDPPRDVLLGAVAAFAYREQRIGLRPGDTLLLYTDGLIERRHAGLDEGLALLAAAAERLADREPDRLVDELLSTATGDTDDDTSIVAVHVRGGPPER
ncbi:SpoIIE family protein phosphatase [Streptomyces sp. SS]|uniref:SpoIIE family protein phosphatase n=1 Tax=Streptomyces sp. SS TaxID=260742 RepID=UPI0002FE1140|nr:SpoIIE family protein phosphatase [Streptomyces sp. SS]